MTLEDKISYLFKDKSLLQSSMTHKSFYNEQKRIRDEDVDYDHNEKLEFLGDAVLDLVISDLLIKTYPSASEGDLSRMRASLVNESVLCGLAVQNNLSQYIKLSKGESQTGGSAKPRILSSALEALIGSVFLDGGFDTVYKVIENIFRQKILSINLQINFEQDYKTRLQEFAQKKWSKTPCYEVMSEEGPDHNKFFKMSVAINGEYIFYGQGKSKKEAAQDAAKNALEDLGEF